MMRNICRGRTLSRRTVLRGAGGIALGLPLLEIMHGDRARAADAMKPRRLLVWTTPNGTVIDRWRPTAGESESDFELSEILSPLEAHKQDLVVIQNLTQYGGHGHHCIGSLTGYWPTDRGFPDLVPNGISLDQYLAKSIGAQTPVAALQLGVRITQNRETVSCVSWNEQLEPAPAENNPYLVFNRLFSGGGDEPTPGAQEALARKRSVLDSVLEQGASLKNVLGAADRAVVDNYLDSLRDLEKRLDALEAAQAACSKPMIPTEPPSDGGEPAWVKEENVPTLIDLNRRLITAAFTCDLTRIITLNLSNDGGAGRMHAWIDGVDSGKDWHGHSHDVEVGELDGLTRIEKWYYGELSKLVDGFKQVPEGDGTLLSNSLVFINNEYGPNGGVQSLPLNFDGKLANLSHYGRVMPYLLIGQSGGALKTGRNLIFPFQEGDFKAANGEGMHHTRLLVSILNLMGIDEQTFGDPDADQGPLPGLVV